MSFLRKIGHFFKSLITCFKRPSRASPPSENIIPPPPAQATPSITPIKPIFLIAELAQHVKPPIQRIFYRIKPWVQQQVDRWRKREALRATENIIQPAFFEEQKLKCEIAIHRAQIEFANTFIESANTPSLTQTKKTELLANYHAALKEIKDDLIDNYKRGLSLDVRPHIARNGRRVLLSQAMCQELLQNYTLSLQSEIDRHRSFTVMTLREARFVSDVLNTRIRSLDDRQYELLKKREDARLQMYERDEKAPNIVKKSAEQAVKGLSFFVSQFKEPLHLLSNRHHVRTITPEVISATKERLRHFRNKRSTHV